MDLNEANQILERATPPKVGNSYLVKALAWAIDEVGILSNRLGVDNEKDALLSSMRESRYMAMELEKALAKLDELQRRLGAMVGLYDDPGLSERVANEYIVDPTPEQVREVQYVLARVSRMHRAIAEGRVS